MKIFNHIVKVCRQNLLNNPSFPFQSEISALLLNKDEAAICAACKIAYNDQSLAAQLLGDLADVIRMNNAAIGGTPDAELIEYARGFDNAIAESFQDSVEIRMTARKNPSKFIMPTV